MMTQQIRWLLAGVSERFQGPQALFILMGTYGVIGTKSQEDSVAVRPDLQVSRVAGRRQAALAEVITEREDEGVNCLSRRQHSYFLLLTPYGVLVALKNQH